MPGWRRPSPRAAAAAGRCRIPRAAGSRSPGRSCRVLPKTRCTRAGARSSPPACARTRRFARCADDVRRLTLAEPEAQRQWMVERLQPYRVESHAGQSDGQLTSYYEPVFDASRRPTAQHTVPLYAPPAGLAAGSPGSRARKSTPCRQAQAAAARPRDRLDGRSDRRADAAHPGQRTAAHRRAGRHAAHGAGRLRRLPTSSPTAASSSGCCRRA